jgi:ligand-binding sensor domain-containing protein
MSRYFLIFVLLAMFRLGYCQTNEDKSYEVINTLHGLPSNSVRFIVLDAKGFIWVSTDEGVSKYDGYSFTNISRVNAMDSGSAFMAGDKISTIYPDDLGNIWFGFENSGVTKYNNGQYEILNPNQSGLPNDQIISNIFKSRAGEIWVAVKKNGLYRYDSIGRKFQKELDLNDRLVDYKRQGTYEIYNSIYDIHEDVNGNLWLATHDGLYFYNLKNKVLIVQREKPLTSIPTGERDDLFNNIIPSDSGLWLSSWGGGICFYHFEEKSWSHFGFDNDNDNGEFDNIITDFAFAFGKFWFSSVSRGFGEFDPATKKFEILVKCSAQNLIVDGTGIIWCTFRGGIIKYKNLVDFKYKKIKFSKENWQSNTSHILRDTLSANTYVGTFYANGLHVFGKGGKEKVINYLPWQNENLLIYQIENYNKDSLLINTNENLFVLRKSDQMVTVLDPSLPRNFGHIISIGKFIYIATDRLGLFKYDMQRKAMQRVTTDLQHVSHFAFDKKRKHLWMIGDSQLHFLDISNDELSKPRINLPPGVKLSSISLDKKNQYAFIGSYTHGLFQTDMSDLSVKRNWTNKKDELLSNIVNSVYCDLEDNVWFTSPAFTSSILSQSKEIINYETPLKFEWPFCLSGSNDSSITVTAFGGYYEIKSNKRKVENHQAQLVAQAMYTSNQKLFIPDNKDSNTIVLPGNQNSFSAEFVLTDLYNPFQNTFQFQLLGFDENVRSSNRNYISYDNLPPGEYTLVVNAKNSRGFPAKNSLIYKINVTVPFYKSIFFRYVLAIIILILIYLLYRLRISKIKSELSKQNIIQESEMTALRAQLNPHFIFNTLSSINIYILKSKIEEASSYLVQFSQLIRKILENSSQPMISLEEEIEALKIYLNLELLRFEGRFSYSVTVEEEIELDSIQVPPLLLQPFFENAIWHGILHTKEHGRITMNVKRKSSMIEFVIEDNGIGRKAAEEKKRHVLEKKSIGIILIRRRLEILASKYRKNATLKYEDVMMNESVGGTRVILLIPEITDKNNKLDQINRSSSHV